MQAHGGGYQAYAPAALQAAEAAALQPTPLAAAHAPALQHGAGGHAPMAPTELQQLQLPHGAAAAPLAFPPAVAASGAAFAMPPLATAVLGQQPLAAFSAPPQAPLTAAVAAAAAAAQPGTSGDVVYVNPRQLAAILRRRSQRAKQEERLAALRATKVRARCTPQCALGVGRRPQRGERSAAWRACRCVAFLPRPSNITRACPWPPALVLLPAAPSQVARQRGPRAGLQAGAAPQWRIHEVGVGVLRPCRAGCVPALPMPRA